MEETHGHHGDPISLWPPHVLVDSSFLRYKSIGLKSGDREGPVLIALGIAIDSAFHVRQCHTLLLILRRENGHL